MIALTEKEYNDLLLAGNDLLILLYCPGDAACILAREKMKAIEKLHGKTFLVCEADITQEKQIQEALEPKEIPEILSIKNKRIYKRLNGIPLENQILDLIR